MLSKSMVALGQKQSLLTFAEYVGSTVKPMYSGRCLGQSLLAVIERWPDNTCIFLTELHCWDYHSWLVYTG